MYALLRTIRRRASGSDGFGMIELLAAMIVMAIGILALFAMFHSSSTQVRRAAITSTAAALADSQMERFRAVRYDTIGLAAEDVATADSVYTGQSDGAYKAISSPQNQVNSTVVVAKCPATPCTQTVPTAQVTGADGRAYRVDTYITWKPITNQAGVSGRDVKLVTIVVREVSTNRVWARVSSSFDELSGV
jgi:type IV pilus modification protein PilV